MFEKIMEDLIRGALTIEEASARLANASRADPERTRFWSQRIQTAIACGQIPPSAGRALFDALDQFQPERTVWLEPDAAVPRASRPGARAIPARTPTISSAPEPLGDIEQMRAALFDPVGESNAKTLRARASAESAVTPESASAAPPESEPERELVIPILGAEIKGRYRLVEHLGLGGVGQVFDAIDLRQSRKLERHVTLKIAAVDLRRQPTAFAAIEIAARRSQPLVHPNIAALYDIDRDGPRVFIVMEPLKGRWLSQLIREVRGKGLAYEAAWPIISGVALGLAHAHEHGVLHHDLSPHSVFLCEDGTPKIMSFGLLHAVPTSDESLDVLDTLTLRAYSEAYIADPWGRHSAAHAADDLYPLGVMAYELLTGAHPFQRCSLAQARQKNLSYAPIPGLNRRARKAIDRCLSFEREARPENASRFMRRLQPNGFAKLFLKPA